MSLLLISPAVLLSVFIFAWWLQVKQRNAGWVDVLWCFGVALTGVFYTVAGEGEVTIRVFTGVITVFWFGRLGIHLLRRVVGELEDGRYAYMRLRAGKKAGVVFLVFYLMQASWVWIFSLPAWFFSHSVNPPSWSLLLAALIFIGAWTGEAIADRQLYEFRQKPENRGKTCRQGLWRYSRHPNYFFEWCHWFVYPVLGASLENGVWLWLAPLVMFVFLNFVTGIPFAEQQAMRSRGEDYRHYRQTTPMFIPWKPKS